MEVGMGLEELGDIGEILGSLKGLRDLELDLESYIEVGCTAYCFGIN